MTGPEFKLKKRQDRVSAERVEMLSERLKHLHPEVVDLTKQLTTLVEEERYNEAYLFWDQIRSGLSQLMLTEAALGG